MEGEMSGWMGGWMDGWMDGGRTYEYVDLRRVRWADG
jgi:hypothetical protein